jgi:ABC-type sugar transport system substrate-binding protein
MVARNEQPRGDDRTTHHKEERNVSRTVKTAAATALLIGVASAGSVAATTVPPGTDAGSSGAAELSTGEGAVIGFSQANNGDVWRINQTNQVEQFCGELLPDAELLVTDGQGDGGKQSADVDDLIARGIDVLLLTPLTADELTPAAERALEAGIPVITMDRAVNAEVTQHIGADNKLIRRRPTATTPSSPGSRRTHPTSRSSRARPASTDGSRR